MTNDFDGIIIGSGHNGLTTACYLARAGLKMLVLERRAEFGGATITAEVTRPGFYHNLHANFCMSGPPVYKDLALDEYGVQLVRPPVDSAFMFSKGSSIITYKDDAEKNLKSFAKFSEKDARTIRNMARKYSSITAQEMYSPPKPERERGEGLSPEDRSEYQRLCEMSPREIVVETFESEEIRTWFCMWVCLARGTTDYYKGTGDLIFTVVGFPGSSIVRGGTRQITHGLASYLMAHGGVILNVSDVSKITIKDGVATGVELADGRRFTARKFVGSSVDPPQTFLKLIGEDHLEKNIVQRAKNWKHEDWALFGVHLALEEAPKFSDYPKEASNALMYVYGYDNLSQLNAHWDEIGKGELPSNPGGNACTHTLHDPSYAPTGKHTFVFWQYSPTAHALSRGRSWDDVKLDYLNVCEDRLREFAPNITKDKVIGRYAYTPLDISRRIVNMLEGGCRQGSYGSGQYGYGRPFPECSQYRTPIEGLYLCGASSHPGGAITFGPGYNAANAIAEDLGIKKWWPPLSIWTSLLA